MKVTMASKRNISLIFTVSFLFGVKEAGSLSYVVVPMKGKPYLYLYLAGYQDTDMQITVPNTNFNREVSLRQDNRWTWREEFRQINNLLADALAKGFRIETNQPVNIHVLTTNGNVNSLTAHKTFHMTPTSTRFLLSPYLRKSSNSYRESVYAVAAGDKPTQVIVSKYNNTGHSSQIDSLYLEPYEVIYKEINNTGIDYAIGIELNCSNAVSVFAGNEYTYVPYEYEPYLMTYIQVPPVSDYQKQYVVGPMLGPTEHTGYSVMILFDSYHTECSISSNPVWYTTFTMMRSSHSCTCGDTRSTCSVTCSNPITRGGYVEIKVSNAKQPVIVHCSKPCLTLLVKHSQVFRWGNEENYVTGYISPVASPESHTTPIIFNIPDISKINNRADAVDTNVNIVIPTENINGLVIDGIQYTSKKMSDNMEINDVGPWSVLTVGVCPGVHSVHHTDNTVPMAVHVHGLGLRFYSTYSNSFGFPAIYKVDDILLRTFESSNLTTVEPDDVTDNMENSPVIQPQNDRVDYDPVLLAVLIVVAAGVLVVMALVIHGKVRRHTQNNIEQSVNLREQSSNIALGRKPGPSEENPNASKQPKMTNQRETVLDEVYENFGTDEEYTQLEGTSTSQ